MTEYNKFPRFLSGVYSSAVHTVYTLYRSLRFVVHWPFSLLSFGALGPSRFFGLLNRPIPVYFRRLCHWTRPGVTSRRHQLWQLNSSSSSRFDDVTIRPPRVVAAWLQQRLSPATDQRGGSKSPIDGRIDDMEAPRCAVYDHVPLRQYVHWLTTSIAVQHLHQIRIGYTIRQASVVSVDAKQTRRGIFYEFI